MMTALPRRLLTGTCAVAIIGAWYVLLAPTRVGGPLTPVIVRGESMLPAYEPDDLVIAYRSWRYRVGDVIVFRVLDRGPVVIHRIVDVTPGGLVTQGDNATAKDPWEVPRADVLGRARIRLPRIGWLLDPGGHPVVVAAFAGLVAAVVAAAGVDSRRQAGESASASVLLVLLTAVGMMVTASYAAAATLAVDADRLASFTVPAADSPTYMTNPGGVGGGPPGGGKPGGPKK